MPLSAHLHELFDRESTHTATSTGFEMIDHVTGGLEPGRIWLVTGAPSQGRTTLLLQWSLNLALAGHGVDFVSFREPVARCAARLLSLEAKVSLHSLWTSGDLDPETRTRIRQSARRLGRLDLNVIGPRDARIWLAERQATAPRALVVDDVDLLAGASKLIEGFTPRPVIVASAPRAVVAPNPGPEPDLESTWARAADVVLDVRHAGLSGDGVDRAGEAELALLRNRWGPVTSETVSFVGCYSRFRALR